ncbi:MAG: DUF58 domain-containing protein [Thiobacillus sp.]|nr:DUF58 domain-containing protein [Thiobacillus sp.]
MIPTRRLLFLLWAWLCVGVAAAFWPHWFAWWAGLGVAALVLGALDWLVSLRQPAIGVERRVPGTLALGVWSTVHLRLHHAGITRLAVEVFDHYPPHMEVRGMPQRVSIPGPGWADIAYEIRPTERGEFNFEACQFRRASALGFWKRDHRAGTPTQVKVYPNFAAVAHYALLATDNRLSAMGIHLRQRRGEGLEFHQLREYRKGDMLRQIDWKASSRLKKLISKEYQDERDQQVIFMIDCGRRMHAKDGELSHFDHTLNAVLLLAYVALRQGDTVGLMAFGNAPCFVSPRKGVHVMNSLLDTVYALQAGTRSPDYAEAATELMKRTRKRSLIVLISNLRDEDNEELLPALRLMKRQHLVLLASLQERIINEVLTEPVNDFGDALDHCATHLYLEHRRKAHDAFKAGGILALDIEPDQLPVALVNRYLEIKRSGRL